MTLFKVFLSPDMHISIFLGLERTFFTRPSACIPQTNHGEHGCRARFPHWPATPRVGVLHLEILGLRILSVLKSVKMKGKELSYGVGPSEDKVGNGL